MNIGSRQNQQPQAEQYSNKKAQKQQDLTSYYQNFNHQLKSLRKMQLVTNLTGDAYVDQQKQYVVVSVAYLDQLKAGNKEAIAKVQQGMTKLKQEQDNAIMFQRTTDYKNKQIAQLSQQYNTALKNIQILQNSLQQCKLKLQKKDQQLQFVLAKFESFEKNRVNIRNSENKRIFSHSNKYIQTQFDEEVVWIGNLDEEIEQSIKKRSVSKKPQEKNQPQKNEAALGQMEILKKRFQQVLDNIQKKTQLKLAELQSQKIGIERYCQQNKRLRAQNEELKKKVIQIDEKQIKLDTWKKLLTASVEQIDKNYRIQMQQLTKSILAMVEDKSTPLSITAEQKIKILQTVIDRMQIEERQRNRKTLEIKKILDQVDIVSVSEENIVGTLLGLSAKIKQVVKFLLEEI